MRAAAELITYVSVSSRSQRGGERVLGGETARHHLAPSRGHSFSGLTTRPARGPQTCDDESRYSRPASFKSASDPRIKTHKESSAVYLDRIAGDQMGRFLLAAAFVPVIFGVGLFAVCSEITISRSFIRHKELIVDYSPETISSHAVRRDSSRLGSLTRVRGLWKISMRSL